MYDLDPNSEISRKAAQLRAEYIASLFRKFSTLVRKLINKLLNNGEPT